MFEIAREDWMDYAACQRGSGVDPELFFDEETVEEAKTICDRCDVRDECLDFALRKRYNDDWDGIYGGLTPRERRRVVKKRRKIASRRG